MRCYYCGDTAPLEINGSSGNSVCTGCGIVLEENAIVSEVTFGETGGGAAMVQGSYVGADQTRARAPAGYRQKGGGQESREQTIYNGRKRIQELANALRLPDRLSDSATRYFNLAVNMNFVQGRRTHYVVAACLYSACRMDKTSHMLIDFSDLLEINVFVLGSTYLKLVKELSLQLPTVDPSLYISRFAALLDFGDETQKVAQDAVRLVARMGRDWMHIGRRPAGVCGACLLLAARMNNFRRSVTEIVQVVKIADVTLRKRLDEFKETPSGALTIADFRTLWLDETADPPAFTDSQRREKKERDAIEEMKRQKELEELDEASEENGYPNTGVEGSREFAELSRTELSPLVSIKDGDSSAHPSNRRRRPESEGPMNPPPFASIRRSSRKRKHSGRDDPLDGDAQSPERWDENEEPGMEGGDTSRVIDDIPELDEAIAAELTDMLNSEGKGIGDELERVELLRYERAKALTNLSTSDSLDDLDEDELDSFILKPEEVEAKSRLWMEINRDYLQALADKQTGPDGELRPTTARRIRKRQRPRDSANAQGANAAEATKQMLTKKRFSKKINYAAIDSLFGGDTSLANEVSSFIDAPDRERTPFNIPNPTFSSRADSRASTPARAISENRENRSRGRTQTTDIPAEEEQDEEEEEEEDEEEEETLQEKLANHLQEGEQDWRSVIAGSTQVDYSDPYAEEI